MQLLNVHTLELKEFWGNDIPKYIIASHRWGTDEPTYSSLEDHQERNSEGHRKALGFCDIVARNDIGIGWLWIDTICIDKTNSVELSEAINSMFNWYRKAEMCLAYLLDVVSNETSASICRSAWFYRGWTLQELLTLSVVVFFSHDWEIVGYKSTTKSKPRADLRHLNKDIARTTGIPEDVLSDFKQSNQLSVEQRLAWAAHRQTARPEDMAYSLLGIFGVYIVPIYGEGYEHTHKRLLKEVNEQRIESLAKLATHPPARRKTKMMYVGPGERNDRKRRSKTFDERSSSEDANLPELKPDQSLRGLTAREVRPGSNT